MNPKVLHITHSYGGGVASAIADYAAATPSLDHHLLRRTKPGEYLENGHEQFASVVALPTAALAAMRAIRHRVGEVEPDVVHAHSSFAGVFARLALRRRKGLRIVYTPHCYASERTDVGALSRFAYSTIEWLLSFNTDVVAVCSPRERAIASRHRARQVVYVPNRGDGTVDMEAPLGAGDKSPHVVGVGRISVQKDAGFFLDVIQEIRALLPGIRATWIGEGDALMTDRLRDADITVTGWLTRDRAESAVKASTLYLHTARWEGFPLSLLEANRLGVPIAARRIPALNGAPHDYLRSTPAELATVAALVLGANGRVRADNVEAWNDYLAMNTIEDQRAGLLRAYGLSDST